MIKRFILVFVASILGSVLYTLLGVDFSMAFTLLAAIGFFLVAIWTYVHAIRVFRPNKDKLRQFIKMAVYIFVCYMAIAGISYLASNIFQWNFWFITRILSIAFIICGNVHVRFEKSVSNNVSEFIDASLNGDHFKQIHSVVITPGETIMGVAGDSADMEMIRHLFRSTFPDVEESDWGKVFGDLFEDPNKKD